MNSFEIYLIFCDYSQRYDVLLIIPTNNRVSCKICRHLIHWFLFTPNFIFPWELKLICTTRAFTLYTPDCTFYFPRGFSKAKVIMAYYTYDNPRRSVQAFVLYFEKNWIIKWHFHMLMWIFFKQYQGMIYFILAIFNVFIFVYFYLYLYIIVQTGHQFHAREIRVEVKYRIHAKLSPPGFYSVILKIIRYWFFLLLKCHWLFCDQMLLFWYN